MMASEITLLEYLPNYPASVPACRYDGRSVTSLKRQIGTGEIFQGYAVPYRDYKFRKRVAVVFAKEGKIFVDVGSGPAELLPQPASITGMTLWHEIQAQTSNGPLVIRVFTPPHRHLVNDGMFPEDVEPIVHLLQQLSDESNRQRYLRKFTSGSWGENGD